MQAELVVEFLDLCGRNAESRPQFGVLLILERDNGIETVITARELDDDQDGILGPRLVGRRRGRCRTAQKGWHGQAPGDQTAGRQRSLQEVSARGVHDYSSLSEVRSP